MKKTILYIILIVGLLGCENTEIEFPDYHVNAVYFPLQQPLRTLSLGEDFVDNTLDKELAFDIGVSIGGMYKNTQDWTVDYVVDESLTDDMVNAGGTPILPLPASYYTLDPVNTAVIPDGSFNGLIRVQLTDAFLDDSLAMTGDYVIPLRITGTSADTVLSGLPAAGIVDPDPRIVSDWEAAKFPKDWVIFGIKFINSYHGTYLQRGMNVRYEAGVPVDTFEYNERFVENDKLLKLTTVTKDKVVADEVVSSYNTYSMELSFANITGASGAVTISPVDGAPFAISGTGEYLERADSEEGFSYLTMQAMYLEYSYVDGVSTHQVKDTLVFRDRGIRFEEVVYTIVE